MSRVTPVRLRAARAAAAAVLAGAVAVAPAGCSDDPGKSTDPTPQTAAVPASTVDPSPAAAAGGVCQLLDFFAVEQLIGVQFRVAAAAQRDATATCVLQRSGASFPDLTLALTPTTVTPAAFRTAAVPPGAAELAGVGQAGYKLVRPAAGAGGDSARGGTAGPSVELGWLTRTNQIMVVRYRLAGQGTRAEAEALMPMMEDLARYLDPD